jgi:hypothetical protein
MLRASIGDASTMTRALVVFGCLVLVGAHATGNMKALTAMFDIGLEPRYFLYIAALPASCIAAIMMLRD